MLALRQERQFARRCITLSIPALLLTLLIGSFSSATAQQLQQKTIMFRVEKSEQRMEMIVDSSKILTLDQTVVRYAVNNDSIVNVHPLSKTQIQVAALLPGVTQINLWTEDKQVRSIDVIVYGDARQLSMLLEDQFPNATLKVRPVGNNVIISGYVDRTEDIGRIVRMAEVFYPSVLNNIMVGGVRQIMLDVKVMEVSRTKLRQMGVDWSIAGSSDFFVQSVSGLISAAAASAGTATGLGGDTIRVGLVDGGSTFFSFLKFLRTHNLAKTLAEPKLVTISGRPAFFEVGGEIPYEVPGGLGTTVIEYRSFGTRLDFVPIVLGNGDIRLEVRPRVSELDPSIGVPVGGNVVPGFRVRQVDTAVVMKAGQTLALAGLLQTRVEASNQGIPWLADLPWVGTMFRSVREQVNEIELLVLVTPHYVDAMDPEDVPPCGPGSSTTSPCDVDLFFRGHTEVPSCNQCGQPGCASCGGKNGASIEDKSSRSSFPIERLPSIEQSEKTNSYNGFSEQRDSSISNRDQTRMEPRQPAVYGSGKFVRRSNSADLASSKLTQNRSNTYDLNRRQRTTAVDAADPPGLIGPVGYDVY